MLFKRHLFGEGSPTLLGLTGSWSKQIVNRSINKRFNDVNDDRSVSSITILKCSLQRTHEIERERNLSYWNEMHFNNLQDKICWAS